MHHRSTHKRRLKARANHQARIIQRVGHKRGNQWKRLERKMTFLQLYTFFIQSLLQVGSEQRVPLSITLTSHRGCFYSDGFLYHNVPTAFCRMIYHFISFFLSFFHLCYISKLYILNSWAGRLRKGAQGRHELH